jgi:hypothetical protein
MSAVFVGMMVVAAPLATAAVAVSPNVLPPDATGCTGTLSSNQIENCVAVVGDASYLQSVTGSSWTHFGSVTGHEEITCPSIPNDHLNSSDQTIGTTSDGPLVSWSPDSSVTPGNYCAIFWQKVSGGYSENGPACESVS